MTSTAAETIESALGALRELPTPVSSRCVETGLDSADDPAVWVWAMPEDEEVDVDTEDRLRDVVRDAVRRETGGRTAVVQGRRFRPHRHRGGMIAPEFRADDPVDLRSDPGVVAPAIDNVAPPPRKAPHFQSDSTRGAGQRMMDGQGRCRRAGCAMSLHIENEETCRLAGDLAELTGESVTGAVTVALRARLAREKRRRDVRVRAEDPQATRFLGTDP